MAHQLNILVVIAIQASVSPKKSFDFSFQFNNLDTLSKNLPPFTKTEEDANKTGLPNASDELHPGNMFM